MGTLTRKYISPAIAMIVLILLLVIMLFPFFIIAINAFKTAPEYAARGPLVLPSTISFDSIIEFWERVKFSGKLLNSFIISISVAVLATGLSLLNAYALGIGKIKGMSVFLIIFVVANTLPHESLAYPLYYIVKAIGLYDTKISVIIVFTVIQSAFGTYLLSNVFSAFPRALLEAAKIDGAGKGQILRSIVFPMSIPTLSVLFTFFFIWTWNEFFLPLIMLVSNKNQTVPIALTVTQGQHNMDVTMASASALLGVLPCIIFFIIFQRTLTKGITAGSIK
ncbi:MAG: carbohydrate ABC transporter permease [Spirochaetales bacterium]|nr:carbohydrate ABC transporter permease [Spirochaetales bacterium]